MSDVPHNKDAEVAIISRLLTSDNVDEIFNALNADHFFIRSHRKIFRAAQTVFKASKLVDLITVSQELRDRGEIEEVGGDYALGQLVAPRFLGNLEECVKELKKAHTKRKLLELSADIQMMLNEELEETLPQFEEKIQSMLEDSGEEDNDIPRAIEELEEEVQAMLRGDTVTGIPIGINSIDGCFGGLRKAHYYAVAGRPGTGKTSLGTQAVLYAAQRGKTCLVISIEMTRDQIVSRMACQLEQLNYDLICKRKADKETILRYQAAYRKLNRLPLFARCVSIINGPQVRSMIRRYARRYQVELVVIDYIQLIDIGGKDMRRNVTQASQNILMACKETGVAALVLAQLSRESEREGRPRLGHLKESGQIEQDAHGVILMWRDDEVEMLNPWDPVPIIATIAKNRNGPSGYDQKLWFNGDRLTFRERNT